MSVSDYITNYRYKIGKLKDFIYVGDDSIFDSIQIVGDGAIVKSPFKLDKLNGSNVQLKEQQSTNENLRFTKNVQITIDGYYNFQKLVPFKGDDVVIVENQEGTRFLVNPEYTADIEYTFTLNSTQCQTVLEFDNISNLPVLKIVDKEYSVFENATNINEECKYRLGGVKDFQVINFNNVALNRYTKHITIFGNDSFKQVQFNDNTFTLEEKYKDHLYTDTINFDITLDNYKSSWHYDLVKFLDRNYSAIVTPKGFDDKFYVGFNLGLQPSYEIETSTEVGGIDNITITFSESSLGSLINLNSVTSSQSTDKSWVGVRSVITSTGAKYDSCECYGDGIARYLVQAEVDAKGDNTGRYKVLEGYADMFPNLNIVGTFTDTITYNEPNCSGINSILTTNIPTIIYMAVGDEKTYNVYSDSDWSLENVSSYITLNSTGNNGGQTNQLTVSLKDDAINHDEGTFTITNGNVTKVVTVIILKYTDITRNITAEEQVINLNVPFSTQYVVYKDKTYSINEISNLDGLTFNFNGQRVQIKVPMNDSTENKKVYELILKSGSSSIKVTINQDHYYEEWHITSTSEYRCDNGSSYQVLHRFTGLTAGNLSETIEVKLGDMITQNDRRCANVATRYSDKGHYTCYDGKKYKLLEEEESYDNGSTWSLTGRIRLGDADESDTTFCSQERQYKWQLTTKWQCDQSDNASESTTGDTGSTTGETTGSTTGDTGTTTGGTGSMKVTYLDGSNKIFDNLVSIEKTTDSNKKNAKSVEIYDGVKEIGLEAFSGCTSLTDITIPDSVTRIGSDGFMYCSSLASITLPDSITSIGWAAFYECSGLTSITLSESITTIDDLTLYDCSSLTEITIPNSVTSIGQSAFEYCTGLTDITIPDSVTSIGYEAFYRCLSLTGATLSDSLTSIGQKSFADCDKLKTITIKATTPPSLVDNAIPTTIQTIYVPASSVNSYKSANGWKDYASKIKAILN